MFWVILCSNTWFMFVSEQLAESAYNKAPNYVQNEKCETPKSTSNEDIDFYKSHDFKPTLLFTFELTDGPENNTNSKSAKIEVKEEKKDIEKKCYYSFQQTGLHEFLLLNSCNPLSLAYDNH